MLLVACLKKSQQLFKDNFWCGRFVKKIHVYKSDFHKQNKSIHQGLYRIKLKIISIILIYIYI